MSYSKRKSVRVSDDTWRELMEIKKVTGKSFDNIIREKMDLKEI